MDYQEITGVGSPEALIDAICTFVGAHGWTVDRNNLVGANRTATIHLPGVSDYIHFFNTNTSELNMRVSVGYAFADAPDLQPNVQPYDSRTNGLTGPYSKVYLFCNDDEDAFHVVISTSMADEYRHVCFGMLEKIGSYTGGTYADGSYRNPTQFQGDITGGSQSHTPFYGAQSAPFTSNNPPYAGALRADVTADSRTNFFHYFGDGQVGYGGMARTGITTWTAKQNDSWLGYLAGGADRNLFSGRTILHPIHVFIDRTGSPTYMSPIGTVKNTRFCNLAKLAVGQEITIGSEVWKVFPLAKKSFLASASFAAPNYGSHTAGYAIRKS